MIFVLNLPKILQRPNSESICFSDQQKATADSSTLKQKLAIYIFWCIYRFYITHSQTQF